MLKAHIYQKHIHSAFQAVLGSFPFFLVEEEGDGIVVCAGFRVLARYCNFHRWLTFPEQHWERYSSIMREKVLSNLSDLIQRKGLCRRMRFLPERHNDHTFIFDSQYQMVIMMPFVIVIFFFFWTHVDLPPMSWGLGTLQSVLLPDPLAVVNNT